MRELFWLTDSQLEELLGAMFEWRPRNRKLIAMIEREIRARR